ncbi:hypothetical protein GCM10028805_22610 [Spirosoma harenae]
MPKRLYEAASQTATVLGAPNTGIDIVPGNIIKCIFVDIAGWNAYATAPTEVNTLTSAWWTAFLAATGTSHAVTPFIDAFDLPPTTALTEGGDDTTTYNGVPRQRSISYATAKGKLSGIDNTQAQQLRKLAAKSGNFQQGTRIGVIFIHEGTGITYLTGAKPIPCFNIFIGDPKMGGLGASDDYEFQFHLEGGWSFTKKTLELAFEGGTLTNPAP